MVKSDLKTLIAGTVGLDHANGIQNGFDFPPWTPSLEYVLQDGSVVLRRVAYHLGNPRNADVVFKGRDVVGMMAADCVRWLSMPHVLCFGLVMDKPSFVTLAKLPEQRKRDLAGSGADGAEAELAELAVAEFFSEKKEEEENEEEEEEEEQQQPQKGSRRELSLDTEAPGGAWASVLHCRETRQRFVRFIMRNLVLCLPDSVLASGKMLLVDFEDEEGNAESVRYTREQATRIEPPNRIGEFDVSFLYWMQYLFRTIGHAPCLVLTIDTDLLMIALLYAAETGKGRYLHMYLEGKRAETSVWVQSGRLMRALADKVPGRDNSEKIQGVVRASVLAGSDFTTGFAGVGHKTMYKALLEFGGEDRAAPSSESLLYKAARNKRSRDGSCWRDSLPGQEARTQFTLSYWMQHLTGDGDVFVDPFEAHGDNNNSGSGSAAQPGWRRDAELAIVEL